MAFDLTTNPFPILGVSPRDGGDVIAQALEDRLADGEVAEDILHRAHQSLMASKSRLAAEVAWLVGMAPARAGAIARSLHRNDRAELQAALRSASGLLRANLAAQIAAGDPHPRIVATLIEVQNEIRPAAVTELINAERRVAGFPKVEQFLVEQALEGVRSEHIEAALGAVTAAEHPGRFMTELVECRLDAEGPCRDFLERLGERYDSWSGPTLHRVEEQLDAAIALLRANTSNPAALKQISACLTIWDEYNQPRQLIFQAKHLNEPRSQAIYGRLRDLALWLANEKKCFRQALHVSRALLRTFPELPSVIDQVPTDIETLEDLVEQAEHIALFAELAAAVEAARRDPVDLSRSVQRGHFALGGSGTAGRLYRAFAEATTKSIGHERADLPWLSIRQLSIELHNERQETDAALRLVATIRSFSGARPSPEVQTRLKEDEETLRREQLHGEVTMLSHQERWDDALTRIAELEGLTEDADQRRKLGELRRRIEHRKGATTRRWLLRAAVAAAMLGMIWLSDQGSEPTRPHNPVAPRAGASAAGVTDTNPSTSISRPGSANAIRTDAATASRGSGDVSVESTPPIGTDTLMNRSQLRYCLFQEERLDQLRGRVRTNAQIDRFNGLAADWNGRCGSYRYYERDMRAVAGELAAERPRLRTEAQRLAVAITPTDSSPPPHVAPAAKPDGPLASGLRLLDPTASSLDAATAQRRLAELGFYRGAVDGIWGGGSRRALTDFKRSVGLTGDATWTRQTQTRLFAGSNR